MATVALYLYDYGLCNDQILFLAEVDYWLVLEELWYPAAVWDWLGQDEGVMLSLN